MAPDIKKIKQVPEIPQKSLKSAVKVPDRSASKPKRKATDDASPITLKKAKSAKQTSTKPTGQIAKKDEVKKLAKKKSAQKQNDSAASESLDFEAQTDNDVLLLADELDSGDDVATPSKAVAFKPGQDVGKVPATPKDAMKKEKSSKGQSGVVYIGRIPHGFYEYEMRQYLSQFGPVSRIRLSRNKKTGASKHFAFVEFEDEDTAEIVAKTMDNYLLFGHILKVKMVPKSEIHEELFKGANRRYKKVPWNRLAGKQLAKPKTETTWEVKVERERASRARKAHKLNALGYEFSATNLKDVPRAASLKAHGATEEDILATTLEQGDSGVVTEALMPIRKEQDAGVAAETATVSQKTALPVKVSKSGKREKKGLISSAHR